ncbi:MAG: hypothetical protein ACI4NU_10615 [Christensenellales bacterium]
MQDGIVDYQTWIQQKRKVLFLLKETNDYDGDLRELLREGYKGTLWNNVVRWSCAVQPMWKDKENAWEELEHISFETRRELLKRIAIVNVKKTPGSSIAIRRELEMAMRENKGLLQKQIQSIQPDIIICGGTEYYFKNIFDIAEADVMLTDNDTRYCFYDEKLVLFYYHPGARKNKKEMFERIWDAARYAEKSSVC